MKEQQGWVAVQEEVNQEWRVGDKKRRDSDCSEKGHHLIAPKQGEQGRPGLVTIISQNPCEHLTSLWGGGCAEVQGLLL